MEPTFRVLTPYPPIPFSAGDKTTLVYELFLFTDNGTACDLTQVKIENGGSHERIAHWDTDEVKANMRYLNREYRPTEMGHLTPETVGLVYFWLEFDPDEPLPAVIWHELTLKDETGSYNLVTEVLVQSRAVRTIEPPVKGKRWLAGDAASNTTGHRRTPLLIDGEPYFAQRYAVDWVQFDENGRMFAGAPDVNENWFCYGAEVLAVADGVVTSVQDGIIENVPLSEERAVKIDLQSAPGNTVVIDHGDDHFATYAHLIPGSIPVEPGQAVKCGQVIGRLGNSGNSTGPHLHFHIGHRNSALGTHGLPYHLRRFTWLGNIEQIDPLFDKLLAGGSWQPEEPSQTRQNCYMGCNDVLDLE